MAGIKDLPKNEITTVLFDLDDTLLDTFRTRELTIRRIFADRRLSLPADWDLSQLRGLELRDIFRRSGVRDEDTVMALFNAYRRLYWGENPAPPRLYPGVREMLLTLSEHDIKMGVVTTKGRDFIFEGRRAGAATELEKTGVRQLFQTVTGFEDVAQPKPDPAGIRLAMEKLGASARETLYVGDSRNDMLAAHNAGCRSCHAHWDVAPLENFTTDYTAASPAALVKLILPGETKPLPNQDKTL